MQAAELVDELLADAAGDITDARLLRVLTPPAPAAGAEFTVTVPAGDVWDLISVRLAFTASAVVANRIPQLVLDDGQTEYLRTASATVITNGVAAQLSTFRGMGADVAPGVLRMMPWPTPPTLLAGGHRLRTVTVALDAGDVYATPVLLVRRLSMTDVQQAAEWLSRQMLSTEHTDLGG